MSAVETPEQNPKKVTITPVDADFQEVGEPVSVRYNPTEYSVDAGANYAEQSLLGLQAPITQFVNGSAESISMELFFDTYETKAGIEGLVDVTTPTAEDIRAETGKITDLLIVDSERHAPPIVRLEWGTFRQYAVLERANTRFTLFGTDGTPVRARMDVTFKQYARPELEPITNPRNSADRTKRRVVVEGETLTLIAAEEYGDPTAWRTIAAANDIDDARTLAPGRTLVLPPLRE
jgi:nucleoid-associated protein YgaU